MQRDSRDETSVTSPFYSIAIDRLPIQEYRDLKQRKFFRWAILNLPLYVTKLLAVWIAVFLLALSIVGVEGTSDRLNLSSFVFCALLAQIAVLFCLTALYRQWHYLYLRLVSKRIIDFVSPSQKKKLWYKSEAMLSRDLLVARFQVLPFLQRIKKTILLVIFILSFLVLFLIVNP